MVVGSGAPRARSDARRNRVALLAAATTAFATSPGQVSLESVAAAAGVGIATLYRHFPTRQALVEAVYRDQVQLLADGARDLLAVLGPSQALRAWMDLLLGWAATKHGMGEALGAVVASGTLELSAMRAQLVAVVKVLLDAGAAAGDLRADADPAVVAALLAGVVAVAGRPEQHEQARRMLDLVADGLDAALLHSAST